MKLIVIYGSPASGKYTIAKLLAKETGYKLFHNHLTVDLLKSFFTFGTPEFIDLSQKIRLDIIEEAAKQNLPGLIFTFVYEKDTVDDKFIRQTVEKVTSHGGEITFIQISCSREKLLERVKEESRKEFLKVKSEEGLLNMLEEGDVLSPIPFVKSTQIDNTHLSVEETFQQALEAIK